jgi:hypothetical protein
MKPKDHESEAYFRGEKYDIAILIDTTNGPTKTDSPLLAGNPYRENGMRRIGAVV